ncbi:MFS multidrug transporter-like protein [Lindgomyces ingoldianus]|uniref:MFS multidrug transporter-like protein n=1 Tax=Lindgomyces ingoldianus TaxID=673940 RepID=A0ACB6QQ74_9PLEO|nr:MFS multidrug transporter-like protein [Lindgomyces ingoldianus]KAF2469066.1 MFS multidrug transporter-like protein [Lindgomyces ingoldianus]
MSRTGLALFIVQTESSVTSTTIVSITNDLGGFQGSSWVFTAYLLTYGGFPIIISRLSDIFGRKQALLACLLIFIVFSGACGASQSILQLIMFRWIKGIGASGITAIATLYGFELRPPDKWASYGAIISFTITISLAVAPIIGAAFAQIGQWRWAFLMNVPIGVTTIIILLFAMPNRLVLEPAAAPPLRDSAGTTLKRYHSLFRLDFLGVFTLLGASVFITAALQQAAKGESWESAQVLAPLILAPIFLLAFLLWQWRVTSQDKGINPILSWNLLTNRIFLSVMANSWLAGAIMTVTIIQIPQRFVLVNGLSPMAAGVRLLPFTTVMASSSVLASIITSKAKIPVVNVLIFAGLLMIAGTVGLSQTPVSPAIWGPQYGFQILAGVGVGIFNVMVILLPPYIVERQYLAVANGAMIQMRILGGALALAITTSAASPSLRHNLLKVLSPQEAATFLDRTETIAILSPTKQAAVREINGKYYDLQMNVMIGFAVASVFFSVLQWQKKPIILKG